uniref:Protein wntless n=1 Tax=Timema poppense TaxID=170557 RepID=A0A7R9D8S1_TIMPO|nr:unnamed protein product [Timema poppensis]
MQFSRGVGNHGYKRYEPCDVGAASEGRWKWDDEMKLEFTSAFFTGVYGMWNIYIFALIVLYAPSHKQWPTETENHGIVNEEIEFSRLATDPMKRRNVYLKIASESIELEWILEEEAHIQGEADCLVFLTNIAPLNASIPHRMRACSTPLLILLCGRLLKVSMSSETRTLNSSRHSGFELMLVHVGSSIGQGSNGSELLIFPPEADWIPVQTPCFIEKSGSTEDLWPGTLTTKPQRQYMASKYMINIASLTRQMKTTSSHLFIVIPHRTSSLHLIIEITQWTPSSHQFTTITCQTSSCQRPVPLLSIPHTLAKMIHRYIICTTPPDSS